MIVRYPRYFSEFSCLASRCPDTCCQGWAIQIDKKTLKRYKSESGSLKKKLSQWVDFQTGNLKFQDGVCPFLEQGLCSLQRECGEQMLCRTCRTYPRHAEEYGVRREYSLSLSCPEAARLLLCRTAPIEFAEKETSGRARPEEEVEEPFLHMLTEIRRTALKISQNREVAFEYRICAVLAMCRDIQSRIGRFERRPRLFEIPDILDKYESGLTNKTSVLFKKMAQCRLTKKEKQRQISKWMDILFEFRPAERHWDGMLLQMLEKIRQTGWEEDTGWTIEYEHVLVSYLDLYLPGAVYDDDLLTKAELAVFHCLVLRNLETCLEKTLPEILFIYARELEHSQENLEHLEKRLAMEGKRGFLDLMGCVLPPVHGC